jgi:hypothetical protein
MRRRRPLAPTIVRLVVLVVTVSTAVDARVFWAHGAPARAVLVVLVTLPIHLVGWVAAPEVAAQLRRMAQRWRR